MPRRGALRRGTEDNTAIHRDSDVKLLGDTNAAVLKSDGDNARLSTHNILFAAARPHPESVSLSSLIGDPIVCHVCLHPAPFLFPSLSSPHFFSSCTHTLLFLTLYFLLFHIFSFAFRSSTFSPPRLAHIAFPGSRIYRVD